MLTFAPLAEAIHLLSRFFFRSRLLRALGSLEHAIGCPDILTAFFAHHRR